MTDGYEELIKDDNALAYYEKELRTNHCDKTFWSKILTKFDLRREVVQTATNHLNKKNTIIWLSSFLGIAAFASIMVVLLICYKKRRKKFTAKDFEITGAKFVHSAPQSRVSSPTQLSKNENNKPDTSISRSTNMSDIYMGLQTKPPQRVQPTSKIPKTPYLTAPGVHHIHQQIGGDQSSSSLLASCDAEMERSGTYQVCNTLYFTVFYKRPDETLYITIIKAECLTGRGRSKTELRDPFVKLCLLRDEKWSHQTAAVMQTLSPFYNETFTFQVDDNTINHQILKLSLYDVDSRRIRHTLGHVYLPLDSIDLQEEGVLIRTLEQSNQYQVTSVFGEINVGMYFDPSEEKCKVTILEAKELKQLDLIGNEQIYVKVQMMDGMKTSKIKKTSIIPAGRDPDFNESFSFPLHSSRLESTSFKISLMVIGSETNETMYGRISIGSYLYARGCEQEHWQEMTENKRKTITKWHSLTTL